MYEQSSLFGQLKTCSVCKATLPATAEYFYRNRHCPDGFQGECKPCCAERQRRNRAAWTEEQWQTDRDRQRERYAAETPEQRETRRLGQERWKSANLDKHRDYQRAYQKQNYPKLLQWRRNNPERVKAWIHRRRAAELEAEGDFTADDIAVIYQRQGGKCFYCEVNLNGQYQIDHMTPLSRGGTNYPQNLCCACAPCNQSKGDKTTEEFINYRKAWLKSLM